MAELTYGSVCSGIEAATVAWHDLGYKPIWFSEIEPFPSTLLKHRYPTVSNLGDMTLIPHYISGGVCDAPDVLVGGTPCQAFSVAGLRNGLDDHRGQLTLSFVELANAIDETRQSENKHPCVILWENVPGVLSSKDNAFGCFLAGLAGEDEPLESPGKKWANAGVVLGPQRAVAWRILDAQYFGLAQRRRRVFVVASARDGFNPAEILFEFDGLRRDTPPSREARKEATGNAGESTTFSCGGIGTYNLSSSSSLMASGADLGHGCEALVAFTQNTRDEVRLINGDGAIAGTLAASSGMKQTNYLAVVGTSTGEMPHCLNAGGMGCIDYESETMIVHGTMDPCTSSELAFTVGRNNGGENVVCRPINTQVALRGNALGDRTGFGIGSDSDPAFTLQAAHSHAVAIAWSEELTASVDLAGTLQYGGQGGRHDGVCVWKGSSDVAGTLRANPGSGFRSDGSVVEGVAIHLFQVRRLTPTEHERLQGFPDLYTLVPFRGKSAADGNRYKSLGNSMAVPVMRWIGHRIQQSLKG